MSDINRGWMPFWLATYIFIVGYISLIVGCQMFCIMAYEAELEYSWEIGIWMATLIAVPWVWYFTYIAHRYFNTVPAMYHILAVAPFIVYAHSTLSRGTLYSTIFSFNGSMYAIHIGLEVILQLSIILVVIYELRAHRNVHNEFLTQIRRALDDI
jgi:hypothetical protein